jgi:hypothetical protein
MRLTFGRPGLLLFMFILNGSLLRHPRHRDCLGPELYTLTDNRTKTLSARGPQLRRLLHRFVRLLRMRIRDEFCRVH